MGCLVVFMLARRIGLSAVWPTSWSSTILPSRDLQLRPNFDPYRFNVSRRKKKATTKSSRQLSWLEALLWTIFSSEEIILTINQLWSLNYWCSSKSGHQAYDLLQCYRLVFLCSSYLSSTRLWEQLSKNVLIWRNLTSDVSGLTIDLGGKMADIGRGEHGEMWRGRNETCLFSA